MKCRTNPHGDGIIGTRSGIDLMPKATEVTPHASPTPSAEQVPSEQGDIVLLEYDLGIDVYNITFDESQYNFIQACKAHISDEHASLAHFEEWVIVLDLRRQATTFANATKAYVEATSSSVKFMIAENQPMAK